MGKAGAVGARELSRFARNSMDWQRLVEVCRDVDTLLIDQEPIYDLRKSNDRLLLGLKGNLNECKWMCCMRASISVGESAPARDRRLVSRTGSMSVREVSAQTQRCAQQGWQPFES